MSGKDKAGRETRKPKAAHNVKAKGQTPAPASAADAINHKGQASR